MLVHNGGGQCGEGVCRVEVSFGDIHVGRLNRPLLAFHGLGVKDGPDGPAAIERISGAGERCVEEIGRVVLDVRSV